MSKPSTLKKYLLIVKLLQNSVNPYQPLSAIQDLLTQHGFSNVSERTLRRDLDALHNEFGIPVEYSVKERGWFINTHTDEDLGDYKQFVKLLELADRVETITHTFKQTSSASKLIVFEQTDYFQGSEYLSQLLDAIQRQRRISFTYHSYEKEKARTYKVEPYLIVEYRNRWYLLGWDLQANKVKTFGLDRMANIALSRELIQKKSGVHYKSLFQHTYGITCLAEEPQQIVLSFTPKQGKYLKSLPLHASQQILKDNADEFRIALYVIINYELKKEILSYGSQVKVLSPAALQKEMIEELKKSLQMYLPGQVLAG